MKLTALGAGIALLLAYGAWSALGTLTAVSQGESAIALSQGLIRLAGVGLLAWGLARRHAWAWWFTVGAGSVAALSGVVLLVTHTPGNAPDAGRLLPLAALPALMVAFLLMPSARRGCRAPGRRLE